MGAVRYSLPPAMKTHWADKRTVVKGEKNTWAKRLSEGRTVVLDEYIFEED